MARQSLDSFRRTVTVEWPKARAAQGKSLLLGAANEGHGKIMREQTMRSGIAPDFDAYANRPGNSDLNTVILPGPIVFKYRYLREVVEVALDELRRASPVESGDYVRSHTLYLNGIAMDGLPPKLELDDEIMISNPVPYARRIEVGKTKSGRAFVIQVEPHIYERVAKRILIPRYRNVAKITFEYATLPDGYTITGGMARQTPRYATGRVAGARGGGTMRKRRSNAGQQVRAPAIVIQAIV